MVLIIEIMLIRTIFGEKLCVDVIFIAACNLYRIIKKNKEIKYSNLIKKNNNIDNLVYNFHPLFQNLFNFVISFGNLTKEVENKYILSMINQSIEKLYKKYKNEDIKNLYENFIKNKEIALKWIIISQNFIRNKYGIASVSLRDIRWFIQFFEFFLDYLQKRQNINANKFVNYNNNNKIEKGENIIDYYYGKNFHELIEYSINLSIYICYYLHILQSCDLNKLNIITDNNINNKIEYSQSMNTSFSGINFTLFQMINLLQLAHDINTKINKYGVKYQFMTKNIDLSLILYYSARGLLDYRDRNILKRICNIVNLEEIPENAVKKSSSPVYIDEENGLRSRITKLIISVPNIQEIDKDIAFTTPFSEMVEIIHFGLVNNIPVILEGMPGQGKQTSINYISEMLGYEVVNIMISQSTRV